MLKHSSYTVPGRAPRALLTSLVLASAAAASLPANQAQAAGGVHLVSSSSFVDAIDYVEVTGQVVNRTGYTVGSVAIVIDELSAGGALLGTQTTYANTDRLDNGELSGFKTSFNPPPGYDHHRIRSVGGSQAYSPANHNFSISVANHYTDESGAEHIVGTLVNNNNVKASFVEVDATYLNGAGTAVGAELTFPTTADGSYDMAPGETDSFDITRYGGPAAASFVLLADAITDPSPLPTSLAIGGGGSRPYGQRVPIAGRLTKRGTDTGISGQRVQLLSRAVGATAWAVALSGTTDYDGRPSFSPRPARNTAYVLRLVASSTQKGATSPGRAVTINATLTSKLSVTSTTLGHAATLRATVAPGEAGRVVTLQRLVSNKWTNVTSHSLNSSSQWTFTVKPHTRGTYTYRTLVAANPYNGAGASGKVALRVT